MKIQKTLFWILYGLIMLIFAFLLFFRIDVLVDEPLGIISEIFFPGGGVWQVREVIKTEQDIYFPGLKENVTVIYDKWGVPHIYAEGESDLVSVKGFVHAKDRFFQMDMTRRQARGLLSEIIGRRALSSDSFHLALGMEHWAYETIEALDINEEGREILALLDHYAKGVNFYLASNQGNVSLEYHILGYDPMQRKWAPLDTVVFSKVMARMLSWSYSGFSNSRKVNAMGEGLYREQKAGQYYQIPVISGYGDFRDSFVFYDGRYTDVHIDYIAHILNSLSRYPSEQPFLSNTPLYGSNSWVISSDLSHSGHPVLCNDMHLSTSLPNIWYEAGIYSGETSAYGLDLPGVPFAITGFNKDIAWGFTNSGVNVVDWYFFSELDDNTYLYNDEAIEYSIKEYSIPVRGGSEHKMQVRHTFKGPVLSDHMQLPVDLDNDLVLSFKWIANSVTNELLAFSGFSRAKTMDDFEYFLQFFQSPAQIVAYADKENIAIRLAGLVPIRKDGNGEFIYNGSKGEGKWTGFVPFDELPYDKNPEHGFLHSSNQMITGPLYDYPLQTTNYCDGYRARRIDQMLRDRKKLPFDIEYMKRMQNDIYSSSAEAFLPVFLSAIEGIEINEELENILKILGDWDFNMKKEHSAPTIYSLWEYFYLLNTFKDEYDHFGLSGLPRLSFLEYITMHNTLDHWFDNISTEDKVESKLEIQQKSFFDAVSFLKGHFQTDDPDMWLWGDFHKKDFFHIAYLPGFGIGPYPADGSSETINVSGFNVSSSPVPSTFGASQRMIVDMSDPSNSLSSIPGGQSGRINSRHYDDQLENMYLKGKYRTVNFYDNIDTFPKDKIKSLIRFHPEGEGSGHNNIMLHGIFLILLISLFSFYLKFHNFSIMAVLLILVFCYFIFFLNVAFWKSLIIPILVLNLYIKHERNIYLFSILSVIFIWSGYMIYSFSFFNTLINLRTAFLVLTGVKSEIFAITAVITGGLYCGLLCALLSIIAKRVCYKSFVD